MRWKLVREIDAARAEALVLHGRWVDSEGALVCVECAAVYEPQGACHCPRCGSGQSWRLSLVLNRRSA